MHGLRQQVQRARVRHTWALAIGGGLAINAAVLAITTSAPPPPIVIVEPLPTSDGRESTAMTAPPTSAPNAPPTTTTNAALTRAPDARPDAAWRDLGPCPAPYTRAPRGALVEPPGGETLVGVAASPMDSRLVAVWSQYQVWVTRDGGRAWDRVLDGEARVIDAGFDCHGRVFVLRAEVGLGVRDGARESWNPVPRLGWGADYEANPDGDRSYRPVLVGGGRWIAVIGAPRSRAGHAFAAMTADGGASWWHSELGWYDEWHPAAAWRGDALLVGIPVSSGCDDVDARLVVIDERGSREQDLQAPLGAIAFEDGVLHGLRRSCDEEQRARAESGVVHVRRAGDAWKVTPLGHEDPTWARLVEGPVDLLIIGDRVATVRGGRIGAWHTWPDADAPVTADLAGRVWGLSFQGQLIRR